MRLGIFDSGVGGITVWMELRKQFPGAELVYLGDIANLPYGTKSPAQIKKLSIDCAETLKSKGVDALVVACNTASSHALAEIQSVMGDIPVFGTVEPGIRAIFQELAARPTQPVLVLATRATIKSGAYDRAFQSELVAREMAPRPLLSQACPLLVPLIEEGWIDHPILHATLAEYVKPFVSQAPALSQASGIALLACTHYPWIQAAVEKALPGWTVLNSARVVAESLSHAGFRPESGSGKTEWIFTDPDAVPDFVRQWIESEKKGDAS